MGLAGSLFNRDGGRLLRLLEGSHLGIKCRHRFYCEVSWRIAGMFLLRTFDRWHVGQARKALVRLRD